MHQYKFLEDIPLFRDNNWQWLPNNIHVHEEKLHERLNRQYILDHSHTFVDSYLKDLQDGEAGDGEAGKFEVGVTKAIDTAQDLLGDLHTLQSIEAAGRQGAR